MTDLHTHILPNFDDGAKDIETSKNLLQQELEQNVSAIAFTPHYNFAREPIESFIYRRAIAYQNLCKSYPNQQLPLPVQLGAEVFLAPEMLQFDLWPLCLENTSFMLIEFPPTYNPLWAMEILYELQILDITPIIAHVERYPYIFEDFSILYAWVNAGALIQVNASSIVKHESLRRHIFLLLKHNLVHVVASDTHSIKQRPPLLQQAFTIIEKKMGAQVVETLKNNSDEIFSGKTPTTVPYTQISKFLGFHF